MCCLQMIIKPGLNAEHKMMQYKFRENDSGQEHDQETWIKMFREIPT